MAERPLYQVVRTDKAALSEQVARQILDLITTKRLVVGDRLPPLDELTGYLGVSRTSLREAIKLLDAWGVVTVKHGVGTFVAGLTEDALTIPFQVSVERSEQAIRHLYQVREVLEPAIAVLAAENARPEHIEKMQEALNRMDQSLTNPDEYIQADLAFHSALAEATGNDLFLIVIHPVIDLLQRVRRLAIQSVEDAERAQASHKMIFKHVKAKNADRAREAMLSALDETWREIRQRMKQAE